MLYLLAIAGYFLWPSDILENSRWFGPLLINNQCEHRNFRVSSEPTFKYEAGPRELVIFNTELNDLRIIIVCLRKI